MFLKYVDFIFVPFRQIRAKWVKGKSIKGNIKMDVSRAKNYGKMAKGYAGQAQGYAGKAEEHAAAAGQQAGGQGATMNPAPIYAKGFIFKKHFCGQCDQQLDKSWDHCPYCAQGAASAPSTGGAKTQAFMIDHSGASGHMQLLGWLVPLDGAQRGELCTLAPVSQVGTDPGCTVVLQDPYMSSHHAEVKAEGGVWILRDLGSTNGTFVNDQRIDKRELVDNDVVKFGQCSAKFKTL
jgi:hypothetical protein